MSIVAVRPIRMSLVGSCLALFLVVASCGYGQEDREKGRFGIEAQFYFFDSTMSTDRVWKFMTRNGGWRTSNPIEVDRYTARGGVEMVYCDSSAMPGALIAGDIVFDWRPEQIFRFPRCDGDDSAQNSSAFVTAMETEQSESANTTCWFVITGHLIYPVTGLPDTTPILRIDVLYEVPKGISYVDSTMPDANVARPEGESGDSGLTAIADLHRTVDTERDHEFLYATLLVTKGDLLRENACLPDAAYRQKAIPLDLSRCVGCRPGPLYPGQISRRMNIRVHWLGGEGVALHALALRDDAAQRILGIDSLFRVGLVESIRNSDWDDCGEIRSTVYRRAATIRPDSFEYGPYGVIERMLFDARRK